MSLTYHDGRFWKGDAPFFLIAADYQYYRDRKTNWRDRLEKLKLASVNTVTFYVPWRHHRVAAKGGGTSYDFDGVSRDNRDLRGFLELVRSLGLYMIVKPGPFVHSELNIGGLPDDVSPTFRPEVAAARRHDGTPVVWDYDGSILPAPLDEGFDALCKEWLEAVREAIEPFSNERGGIVALQLNDETIFCTSNDPPWRFGYEPEGLRFYRRLMEERYGDIDHYKRLHGHAPTSPLRSFDDLGGVELKSDAETPPAVRRREDVLQFVDWAEYQWRLRRDLYARYKEYLGIDLPYLTNYAGITPPIEENVPEKGARPVEQVAPLDYSGLYPEWWFAMNRIDHDADVHEYGIISWLGVAAYDTAVFDRYINTARRARGINMEENWGFGTLYDAKSRHPIVPFFQTLVSVAGGATGYVIFVGAGTDYWDDSLDRITKLQCPTFPSHAPIDEHGNCRPMYHTAAMLNRWFAENGEALLRCEVEVDVAYLLYPPYAAVSSWIPDERYWAVDGDLIPRCGREGFEEFSRSLQRSGHSFAMFELDAATPERLDNCAAVALRTAFFMDRDSQEKLASYIEKGGKTFLSGQLPEVDLDWRPCLRLKQAVDSALERDSGNVVYSERNFFADGAFDRVLTRSRIPPRVTYSDDLRVHVHRSADDVFVFFFNLDVSGEHDKWIEHDGMRLELRLGSKTSGVLRIRDGKCVSFVVKGRNEVEDVDAETTIRLGEWSVSAVGDFSS